MYGNGLPSVAEEQAKPGKAVNMGTSMTPLPHDVDYGRRSPRFAYKEGHFIPG